MTSMYARLQVLVSQAEIDDATTGVVFMKFRDSILGHMIGLRYDHTGNQWQVFSDVGQVVNVPGVLVDAYMSFSIHLIPQFDGTVKIQVWHQNTNYGDFITPTPWNFDSFQIGAMDNTAGEVVDHYFQEVHIGSVPGGSDVFDTDNFSANTVVPPFDSTFGFDFTIVANQLHVANSGDANAYAQVQVQSVVIPPNSALADPGDATIIYVGDSDWRMAGQPAWVIDNWGLDRLVIPMRGSRRTRDDFLNSLVPWQPYPGDLNMYLADISQEQRSTSTFPRIDLIFTGKRNGVLPPIREQSGEQVQQISGRSTTFTGHTIGVTFISKTSEQTVWSRGPIDLSTVNPLEPANLDIMWVTETDVIIWAGSFEAYQAIIETNVNNMFVARVVTTGIAEEIVPGQYYRATKTNQRLLFPVLG